ncbi:Mini-ribonuclease 3 [Aminipila luticellarii]|uniref:Mini-ribonuclease 3 n=1 Tax=Aminipila luticellarii TaxID=2507160 RepID=A0A410PX76_9FIRM|nr:ribonuclease III domain-containing protein [Aminipila luticellarii]QAT43538.1 ribonuclease III [Aminipila luticellarii]
MDRSKMNTTALAYIGDAVYEVYVRKYVLEKDAVNVNKQNKLAVRFVRAEGQALAIKKLMDSLPENELALVKRARNKKITSKPQNADAVTYKLATAFEALVGFLYLSEQTKRLEEIIHQAVELIDAAEFDDVRKKIKK